MTATPQSPTDRRLSAVQRLALSALRIMAGASVVLAVCGVLALVAFDRLDLLIEAWIPHMAMAATGFGTLAWLAIPRQPCNRAVWAAAGAALLTGLATAGWASGVVASEIAGIDTVLRGDIGMVAPADLTPAAVSFMVVDVTGWAGLFCS